MSLRSSLWRKLGAGFVCIATMACPSRAAAERPGTEQVVARTLFDQGRKLMAEGKHAAACSKFEESLALHGGVGTVFNLAKCYEVTGRLASAWTAYLRAASEARLAGQSSRERAAQARADALASRIPRVRIDTSALKGLDGTLKLDDVSLRVTSLEHPIPIDPGDHVLTVAATGYEAAELEFTASEGETTEIELPPLQQLPRPTDNAAVKPARAAPARMRQAPKSRPKQAPVAARSSKGGAQRPDSNPVQLVAVGMLASGAVTAVVGSILAVQAKDLHERGEAYCYEDGCEPAGIEMRREATSDMKLASGLFFGGLIATGAGLVGLLITNDRAPESHAFTAAHGRRFSWRW